jgi:hypothetical protein
VGAKALTQAYTRAARAGAWAHTLLSIGWVFWRASRGSFDKRVLDARKI